MNRDISQIYANHKKKICTKLQYNRNEDGLLLNHYTFELFVQAYLILCTKANTAKVDTCNILCC